MKLLLLILLLFTWDFRTPAGDPIALPQYGIVFEIWHASTLEGLLWEGGTNVPSGFTLWTNVDMPPVPIGGQAQEFFMVRTRDTITGEVSDWARSL